MMNGEIYKAAERLVEALKEKNLRIATAESCTGGLVSAYITAVPGSSAVFELGIASYSCRVKHVVLGVEKETLDTLGAVSEETARQMAECIRLKANADIGISVTGVAGPDGSEGHKPGLVFTAAAYPGGVKVEKLNIKPASREYVREQAAEKLLKLAFNTVGDEF